MYDLPMTIAESLDETPSRAGGADLSAIKRMLNARSIALVGVSGRPGNSFARPLRYLAERGFTGSVYPVNPSYDQLQGLKCYPDLADVPEDVDLVISFVAAERTLGVVEDAANRGAAGVVVFASGFSEIGPEGAALQEKLRSRARELGVLVLGPNCQGFLYSPSHVYATFTGAADRELPPASGIAYVGQSGAIGGSVMDLAAEMGIGLTAWVSTGNQVDLDHVSVARALIADGSVNVLMLYVEGVTDGAEFTRLCREARSANVALILLRSGRSESGRRAAASHTGSMLGDDAALTTVCRSEGVVLVEDVDELVESAVLAATSQTPGRSVAVITTSGGAGSLAADHCDPFGLQMAELAPTTKARLSPLIPSFGSVANPVDVTADILSPAAREKSMGEVCRILADDPAVDVILIVLTMVTGEAAEALARDVTRTAPDLAVPVVVVWMAGFELTVTGREIFRGAGIPVFGSVSSAARTVGRACSARERLAPADPCVLRALPGGVESVVRDVAAGERLGEELLDALGVAHPVVTIAASPTEATTAAARAAGPVAVKIHAPGLLHKSEVGGVALGVDTNDVAQTFERLTASARSHGVSNVEGVLVQEMIPNGTEILLALTSNGDGYPPIVTIGFGGVTTEIYQDLVSAPAPVSAAQAETMLRQLRAWPLLDGFRGSKTADVDAAAEMISRFSSISAVAAKVPLEIEVNPLIVGSSGDGAQAADIIVTLRDVSPATILRPSPRAHEQEPSQATTQPSATSRNDCRAPTGTRVAQEPESHRSSMTRRCTQSGLRNCGCSADIRARGPVDVSDFRASDQHLQ